MRATSAGGAANQSTSFVSGSRSKCFADIARVSALYSADQLITAPVSEGSFSTVAFAKMLDPPAAVIMDRSMSTLPGTAYVGG